MNSSTPGLKTTHSKQQYNESSDFYYSSMDRNVHPGPTGTAFWQSPPSDANIPEIYPYQHHHTIQPGLVDPPILSRCSWLCQSTQCEITYPNYSLEPQSTPYLPPIDTIPGPPVSNYANATLAPWFGNKPIFCSMIEGDSHTPEAGICAAQLMNHQQVWEGLTEVKSHTQPVVCNMSGGGQVVLVNLCEPGPPFLTMESAPAQRDDGLAEGKDENIFGIPNEYHQRACALYESRDQIVSMYPKASVGRAVGEICESKSRKPCHCTRSKCLKLYCECFASRVMCSNCDCSNCHNNAEHDVKRHKAIKSCLGRNPDAFRPKFAGGKLGEVKGWHNRGCNCKRSGCLKNYCECFEANIMCTSSCKCIGCRNYDKGPEMGLREETDKDTWSVSVITPAVVKAVCGCLLAQAEEAEREARSHAQAEQMVLNEFGHCLTQIVKAMFKHSP